MKRSFIQKYWPLIVAVLLSVVFLFVFKFNLPAGTSNQARIVIYFSNNNHRIFEGPVESNMTILEALFAVSDSGKFDIRYSIKKDNGVELAAIDKIFSIGLKKWRFYLNKKQLPTEEINKIKIKARDLVEIKYE